jgi:hypothetical protein
VVRDNIAEAEVELRKRGRPVPQPVTSTPAAPQVAPSPPVTLPPGVIRDVIRGMAQADRGRRLHLAEDLPPKKAEHAREILGTRASEPVVAFFDLTLMGGGRDAIVLTEHTLAMRDGDEHLAVPLAGVASALLVGTLEDRMQISSSGSTLTFSVGNHGETLVRVLGAVAMTFHRARTS